MPLLNITELDVFQYLGRLVRAWPATYEDGVEQRHKRINTFAVIDDDTQLDAKVTGKDQRHKGKDYFFSRVWEDNNFKSEELQKELPALLMWEQEGTMELKNGIERLTIQAVIQEEFVEKFDPGTEENGRQRTQEEIKADVKALRDTVLEAIHDAVFVRLPGDAVEKAYPRKWLDANGHNARGAQSMLNFVSMDNLQSQTIAQSPNGGFIESYFSFTISRSVCEVDPGLAAFNFDADFPDEAIDHPGGASA